MENSELLYDKLRDLYSKEGTRQDSISKGLAIEKIVNRLMADVVSPYDLKLDMVYGKNRFDGGVSLGRGKILLYEIYLGSIPWFDYNLIFETIMGIHFLRRTYLLNIAYSFSEQDRIRIQELVNRIRTSSIKVCFVDYETLMTLHKFSNRIHKEDSGDTRKAKVLFLEKLFESSGLVSSSIFEDALVYAEDHYSFEVGSARAEYSQSVILEEPLVAEERLGKLEEMAQNLLDKIRELKDELKKKQYSTR